MKTVLITGGAGFIGSHLADELLRHGHRVRALDVLCPQVHGDLKGERRPAYLDREVELQVGDVRDPGAVEKALAGVDAVFHFAARVGVGQSMYDIAEYTSVNNLGTAVLLEALARKPVERLIVASSMSVYGEGSYRDATGREHHGCTRTLDQLRSGEWELRSTTGEELTPIPTSEHRPASLESVYALSKYDQERLCLVIGRAYGISTIGLRFFNVYGTRQALSNPYTGVLAIFAARLLNNAPPLLFEDGKQRRDFVAVRDVARACRLALVAGETAAGRVFNIGSGEPRTVRQVAEAMAQVMSRPGIQAEVSGRYRMGDVRHCFADIRDARDHLGYRPEISFRAGLDELAGWLETQVARDRVSEARAELDRRGLTL